MRQPPSLPPYLWELRLHLSFICLLACAAPRSRPPPSGEGRGSKAVQSGLCSNFERQVEGLRMRLGRPWLCIVREAWQEWSQKLHHQDGSAALCGPSRAWQRSRKICCKASFWQRPPPFSGHFRAHGGLHSCAACQLSEHHSDHGAAARTIGHHKSCRVCQSCCSKPSFIV